MTRRLILMRHAKSSWSHPDLPDHDRPLNKRGQRSARALGDWLRTHGYLPDRVLCSSALRALQTRDGLGLDHREPPVPALYHADPGTLLRLLRAATGHSVLLIGHNPGIAEFAKRLVATPPDHPRFADYPTGATLIADFDIADWPDLHPGSAAIRDFIVPRELPGV